MFTGLVAGVGRVERTARNVEGLRVEIVAELGALVLGESVSVSGCCLTVVAAATGSFSADLTRETLARTTLGRLAPGGRVNLERAAALGDRLGGHLVTGHVDGVARVLSLEAVGDARRVELEVPAPLARYIAEKGSVALDGVSLTVNGVSGARFDVMLIPHTLAVTTLGELAQGSELNLEVDLVARYVARFLQVDAEQGVAPAAAERRGVG